MFESLGKENICQNESFNNMEETTDTSPAEEIDRFLNDNITEEEVQIAINNLRNNKA